MITIRSVYFFIFLATFVAAILAIGSFYYLRHLRQSWYPYGRWEDLVSRLGALDRGHIESIAQSSLSRDDEFGSDVEDLDPDRAWELLGGMEGLEILKKNCAVLVDLVFYVQQYFPEALLVAEQLRQNAREVEWHIERLQGAATRGRLKAAIPDYLERAVVIYYRMTQEVISVYQQVDLPGLAELQRAL
jgi:hypothetical protein